MIDSAGTGGHEAGNQIYSSAQKVLKKNGINYQHTARQVLAKKLIINTETKTFKSQF